MLKRNSFKRHFVPFIALVLAFCMSLCSQEAPTNRDLVQTIWAGELFEVECIVRAHPDLLNANDAARVTFLHAAIEANNLPIVSFLIESGADVNAVDLCSRFSLHVAAQHNGCKDIVQLLLVRDANVNARNRFSATALHKAMHCGSIEMAEALLDYGADCEEYDGKLWTPLHYAAYGDQVSAITFLVCCGVLIDVVNRSGFTPLLLALEEVRFCEQNLA